MNTHSNERDEWTKNDANEWNDKNFVVLFLSIAARFNDTSNEAIRMCVRMRTNDARDQAKTECQQVTWDSIGWS